MMSCYYLNESSKEDHAYFQNQTSLNNITRSPYIKCVAMHLCRHYISLIKIPNQGQKQKNRVPSFLLTVFHQLIDWLVWQQKNILVLSFSTLNTKFYFRQFSSKRTGTQRLMVKKSSLSLSSKRAAMLKMHKMLQLLVVQQCYSAKRCGC